MGLSVGLVIHGVQGPDKQRAYEADITYGTNNEFGFDYLRDNMAIYKQEMVQRGHSFAIVDEVDSILIDEARTPLIISGQGDSPPSSTPSWTILSPGSHAGPVASVDEKEEEDPNETADYIVDEKARTVTLTATGHPQGRAGLSSGEPGRPGEHHPSPIISTRPSGPGAS